MRIRDVAAVVFLAAGVAAAQEEPDRVGEHKYAGETCEWTTHNADLYVDMTYKGLVGRIETRTELGSVADAFSWKVMPGPGAENVSSGTPQPAVAHSTICVERLLDPTTEHASRPITTARRRSGNCSTRWRPLRLVGLNDRPAHLSRLTTLQKGVANHLDSATPFRNA